jgi:hypothetical protein
MSITNPDLWVAAATREAQGQARQAFLTGVVSSTSIGQQLANLPTAETYRVVLSSPVAGGLHLRSDGLYDAFV